MKRVLLLGVGRSTHTLIKYLVEYQNELNIQIFIADQKTNDFIVPFIDQNLCSFVSLDVNNDQNRRDIISQSDLVISMLPPQFHFLVAKDCIFFKKNLITASYVSNEIQQLDNEAKKANILILNEIGLDPGIDHLSAMEVIDKLKKEGAEIKTFKSFCGGLIAPEYDNNPWGYKFTWNPKNVILAGSSGATYLKNGLIKKLSYKEVFTHIEKVRIPHFGEFESYANRDSLHYQSKYNLLNADTIVRGTLRKKGFSQAWNIFVQLGMTSEKNTKIVSKDKFLKYLKGLSNKELNLKMEYLNLFNSQISNYNSPSEYLLSVLKDKWALEPDDKDMIVMQHQFGYEINSNYKKMNLSMVVQGDDSIQTGMAKTVGLPVFFACKLILEDKISLKGVRIPIYEEIYQPILKNLEKEGIEFIKS